MYRIRFHGRGGQGVKTAGRILGTAFFLEGFQVQDAPRYGAERRGAPIFAYVRADREVIQERGVIRHPDLVIVVDDSLLALPAAGVLEGVGDRTVVLLSSRQTSQGNANGLPPGLRFVTLDGGEQIEPRLRAAACAGAGARLAGVISQESLREAIRQELGALGEAVLASNLERALAAFAGMFEHEGIVREAKASPVSQAQPPRWVELTQDGATLASPTVYRAVTSRHTLTGLWRTERPVIDAAACKHCWWVCTTYCPDNAVGVGPGGVPAIDYDHCKGCMICLEQCPPHAITAVPETMALAAGQ